ncbi:MAG: polyprenol monophosphomannose synthase [Thermodesulfobacteriota bacterium]
MSLKKIMAMIPTYNEAGHIRSLVEEVLAQDPRMEVLVADDDSPDGTGEIVQEMARGDHRVHLLRRTRRRGRGWAGVDGFKEALALGADAVIEMDGDYSHHPREIPKLIQGVVHWDVVIGSRFVPGGEDMRQAKGRALVTRLASLYIRWVLGVKVKDPTSGYRAFRREVLEGIGLDRMRSKGPSIVEETLHACSRLGFAIREVPICFEERRSGASKLSFMKLIQTAWEVAMIRLRWGKGRQRLVPSGQGGEDP